MILEKYSEEWHREYGKHSSIPDCCIDYWIEHFSLYVNDLTSQHLEYLEKCNGWNYVACPKCLSRQNKVPIHRCDYSRLGCKRFLQRWLPIPAEKFSRSRKK